MIVDDDTSYLEFLTKYLTNLDFRPVRAASGHEALELCREGMPDLIMLDWCLGRGLSGQDTLKAFRQYPATRRVPIVVISAVENSPEDERSAIRTGANLFLNKAEISDRVSDGSPFLRHLQALLPAGARVPAPPVPDGSEDGSEAKRRGTILIVDDDRDFSGYLNMVLSARGHRVESAFSGRAVMEAVTSLEPDLVILDVELGDSSGLEICRRLKKNPRTARVPVMIITGHATNTHWTASIRFGAELFMPKPLTPDQLNSCVDALLARVHDQRAGDGAVKVGSFALNPAAHTVVVDGGLVQTLPTKLFDLAYLLVTQGGRILERQEIMRRLKMTDVRDNEINVLMHVLRHKLGPKGKDIFKTVRGMGYRFDEAGCR